MPLRRHERIHLQNVRIAVGARRHHFDEQIGIPFLCECDDENCHEFVVLPLGDFGKHSTRNFVLVATGHMVEHGIRMGEGDGYELYKANGRRQAAG